jgi:hypothetical protein
VHLVIHPHIGKFVPAGRTNDRPLRIGQLLRIGASPDICQVSDGSIGLRIRCNAANASSTVSGFVNIR